MTFSKLFWSEADEVHRPHSASFVPEGSQSNPANEWIDSRELAGHDDEIVVAALLGLSSRS